eukprot:2614265-Pyramimonas_sp.AAC.1
MSAASDASRVRFLAMNLGVEGTRAAALPWACGSAPSATPRWPCAGCGWPGCASGTNGRGARARTCPAGSARSAARHGL